MTDAKEEKAKKEQAKLTFRNYLVQRGNHIAPETVAKQLGLTEEEMKELQNESVSKFRL